MPDILKQYPAVASAVIAIVAAALTQLANGGHVSLSEVVLAVLGAVAAVFTHTQVTPTGSKKP